MKRERESEREGNELEEKEVIEWDNEGKRRKVIRRFVNRENKKIP